MGIGSKIREYRTKTGLTQKELADELHITYQAVSRWENDDAEPSFDMLRDMCRIFNCSTDDLFDFKNEENEESDEIKENESPQVIERVIVQDAKPVLAVCEHCNKPIYESNEIFRVNFSHSYRHGRRTSHVYKEKVLCSECNEKRLNQEQKVKEEIERERISGLKTRRIHSFIWPSLLAITLLIIAIVSFIKGETSVGVGLLVFALLGYTFLATIILNNTFITDLWIDVASIGFVKMPGIIFSFSPDGLKFLIIMKILFFLIGIALAVLFIALATALGMALSIFAYPFALGKNIKGND